MEQPSDAVKKDRPTGVYLQWEPRLGVPAGTHPADVPHAGNTWENTRREPRARGPVLPSISHGTLPPRCLACSQHFTPFSGGGWGGAGVQVTTVSQLDRPHPGLRASGAEGQGPLRDQAPGPRLFHSAPPQGGEGDAELRLCLGVVGLRVERSTPLPGPVPAGAQSWRPPHSQGSGQGLRHH